MKLWSFLTIFFILCVASTNARSQDVSICNTCTSSIHFEQAALAQVIGNGIPGDYLILTINPETGDAHNVLVSYARDGDVPTGVAPVLDEGSPELVERGAALNLSGNRSEHSVSSSSTSSNPATEGEIAEIGAIIDFTRNEQFIVFPNNEEYFGSFNGRNAEQTSLHIYGALTDRNPGWAGRNFLGNVRQLIFNKIGSYFGRDFRVCGVFNNGDSACFAPQTYAPSVDNYISGTARGISGEWLDGGYGSGGGMEVNFNNGTVGYAPLGYSGATGELWLFCVIRSGVIELCYTVII